jgi:hypothetical protein
VALHEQLAEVYERGMRDGLNSLSADDRELFHVMDFIIDYEMGGLSGYFYNRLPDVACIRVAVAAMWRHGLPDLAALLDEATGLFSGYTDPDPPTTWENVCLRYDPGGRLGQLDNCIDSLDYFGLG